MLQDWKILMGALTTPAAARNCDTCSEGKEHDDERGESFVRVKILPKGKKSYCHQQQIFLNLTALESSLMLVACLFRPVVLN